MNLNDKSKEELVNDLQQLQQSYDSLKQTLNIDYQKYRHIEEALRASEDRYQKLFDKAPLGYQSLDFDGFFIEVNQQWLDTLGYQREEVIGKWFGDFLTPAYQEGFRQRFPIFKSQGHIHSEFEMQHKNGSVLFIAFEGRIGYDLNGKFKQTHCILQDITDRKRIEEDLRNSEENLSITLNSIGDGVISTDITGLIVKMNPIAEKLCGWTLKDAIGRPLTEVFKIINSESREIVEDPVEKVIKSGEIVGLANHTVLISKNGNEYQIADSAAPIKDKKGDISGVVLVFSDVTEKYLAKKIIYENEKRYSSLLSNLEAGIVVHAPDTAIIMNNVRASELLGLTDDQMRGKTAIDPAWDFINEDHTSLKLYEYPVNRIITNKEAIKNQILGIKHPQKSDVVWVSVNGFPVINNSGEITEVVISFIDITERKLAEEEMKSVKVSLELCLEASQIGIWSHDLIEDSEHIKEVSVRDLKHDQIFGYKEKIASWGQEKMLEHVIDEDREATRKAFDNVFEKGRLDFECRILWPDNTIHWIACGGKVYKDSAGQPNQINGTVMDITERKLAEAEILENKIQFQNLANSGPALIWKSGIDKLCNYFNERWMAFTGRTLEQELGNGWAEGVHPEDFDLCLATYIAAFEKQEPFEMEYRLLHFSGEYRWILDLGTPNYNSKGEFIGYIGNCFDITDRKQAEEKIQKQNVYIKMILDNFPIGIATNEIDSMKLTYMNRKFSEIYGWPEDDFPYIGDFFEKVFPDLEYRQQLQTRILADISSGDSERMNWDNLKITTKAGDQRIVYAFNIPMFSQNIMVSTVQDVTERKQAEESLRESEAIKNKMVSNIGDVIVIIDNEGINRYKSPNIEKWFDWKPEDLVGKSTWDNVHPDDLEAGQKFILSLAGEPYATDTLELRYRKKDGSYCPIEITLVNLLQDPDIHGFLGNYHDISERKKTEFELIKAKEKAQESDRLKSAFLANMSHEIRTPMNGILGFADLLKDPELSGEQQQQYIKIIEKSGAHMLNIINDIIDISKIEAGLMNLDIKETNINEQIEYIFTFFKPEVEAKGMQLTFNTRLPKDKALITTDREKLYAIFTNLVKNAIKYSKEGSIELGYNLLKTDVAQSVMEFYVKDSGIGIPKDRQKAIFERFVQADIEDEMARQGAGLGLTITKSYVEMLGGKIWVESEEGIGSCFYFTLPYIAYNEEITKVSDDLIDSSYITKNLKILIAEDDEISELFITTIIKNVSKEILKTRTGTEAIEICRNNPDIDLILMDIKMPGMTGYEACRQIREFNKEVIIIAQTAYGLSGDREKAIRAGCNDYISKPIKMNLLMEMLDKYLKR